MKATPHNISPSQTEETENGKHTYIQKHSNVLTVERHNFDTIGSMNTKRLKRLA
jgi:hypothetical protein